MRKTHELIIFARARADVKEILRHTLQSWGEKKMLAYRDTLEAALERITEQPLLGRIRGDVLMYPVEKHCIYYRISKTSIHVVRILHEKMDAQKNLPR